MGTHPIFESDFDCLTDIVMILRLILRNFSGNHVPRTTCYTRAQVPTFKRMDNFFENIQAKAQRSTTGHTIVSLTKKSRTDTIEHNEEFYDKMRFRLLGDMMQKVVALIIIAWSLDSMMVQA